MFQFSANGWEGTVKIGESSTMRVSKWRRIIRFWFRIIIRNDNYHYFGHCRNVWIISHTEPSAQTYALQTHMRIAPINTLKNQSITFHFMHPEPPIHIDPIPLHSIGIGCNWFTAANDDVIRTIHVKCMNSYWAILLFDRQSMIQKIFLLRILYTIPCTKHLYRI